MESLTTTVTELRFALDTFYFLISGVLVMWMAAGFAMLEAGLVRAKNTAEILTKNVGLYSIACIMYMLCGYAIMYPGDFAGGVLQSITTFGSGLLGSSVAVEQTGEVDSRGVVRRLQLQTVAVAAHRTPDQALILEDDGQIEQLVRRLGLVGARQNAVAAGRPRLAGVGPPLWSCSPGPTPRGATM